MNRRRLLIFVLTLVAVTGAGLIIVGKLRSRSLTAAHFAGNPLVGRSQLTRDLGVAAATFTVGAVLCGVGVAGLGLIGLHDWKRRRTRTDACRQCGYARSGWASERCPECGAVGEVAGGVASKA